MQTVSEYLEHVTPEQVREYERIRKIVHKLVPDTTETMAYGVPTFTYKGKNLLHFGAFKNHMSIFPGSHAIEELQEELRDYKTSRGTIQFTDDKLIPEALIVKLLTVGLADIDATR